MTATREQQGWFFYDWAASAFSTTVVTVFMGPYLTKVTEDAAGADDFVSFLGVRIRDSAWFPAVITTSVLIQIFLLPVVGAVADRARSKRALLALFAGIGSVSTMLMFFVRDGHFELGGLLLIVANVAFGASIVVYNAFLPEISTPDERDAISAAAGRWATSAASSCCSLTSCSSARTTPSGYRARGGPHLPAVGRRLVGAVRRRSRCGASWTARRSLIGEPTEHGGSSRVRSGSCGTPCRTCGTTRRPCGSCWPTCASTTASRQRSPSRRRTAPRSSGSPTRR